MSPVSFSSDWSGLLAASTMKTVGSVLKHRGQNYLGILADKATNSCAINGGRKRCLSMLTCSIGERGAKIPLDSLSI